MRVIKKQENVSTRIYQHLGGGGCGQKVPISNGEHLVAATITEQSREMKTVW